jgi:hypothetical protein
MWTIVTHKVATLSNLKVNLINLKVNFNYLG